MVVNRILRSKYKEMPWKNGGGTTWQMRLEPPQADFPTAPFVWRLSSAVLTQDGPFSVFPGLRRLLTVVEGHGLLLSGRLLQPGEVLEFSGDTPVHAQLVDGPVRDVGVIADPSRVDVLMQLQQLPKGTHEFAANDHRLLVLHGAPQAGAIAVQTQGAGEFSLNYLDLIELEVGEACVLRAAESTRVVVIRLRDVPTGDAE